MDITIPSNIVTDISASVTGTVESLWVLIILIISIPLSFYVLRKIIQLFPKR